jgi:hypothetical protein
MKTDIQKKIAQDFGGDAPAALSLLQAFCEGIDQPAGDRLLRAMVFLARGRLEKLEQAVGLARIDDRDVLWQAEYDGGMERCFDFSRPFEEFDRPER